jgi:hypothetical protein
MPRKQLEAVQAYALLKKIDMGQLTWGLKCLIKGAMSRHRHNDALRIEDTLHNRLQGLLAKHHPDITVKLHRWQWRCLHGVLWGGSFTALVYLNGDCFCGMSFDLIGSNLVISQIHGVHLNRCRYRPMRRFWEVTLVRAAHGLGFRTLLIRADHAISWPDATPEVRDRLVKRLDDTARALGLSARGAYWIWGKDGGQENSRGALESKRQHPIARRQCLSPPQSGERLPVQEDLRGNAQGGPREAELDP